VLEAVDVVDFQGGHERQSDDYDIAFVEGSITRRSDEERLNTIRRNAKVLIAPWLMRHVGRDQLLKKLS